MVWAKGMAPGKDSVWVKVWTPCKGNDAFNDWIPCKGNAAFNGWAPWIGNYLVGKINFWFPVIGNGWILWRGVRICGVIIWAPSKSNAWTGKGLV